MAGVRQLEDALEREQNAYRQFCENTMYCNRSQNVEIAKAKNKMRQRIRKLKNRLLNQTGKHE